MTNHLLETEKTEKSLSVRQLMFKELVHCKHRVQLRFTHMLPGLARVHTVLKHLAGVCFRFVCASHCLSRFLEHTHFFKGTLAQYRQLHDFMYFVVVFCFLGKSSLKWLFDLSNNEAIKVAVVEEISEFHVWAQFTFITYWH